jgi:hypothetical protein
MPPPYEGKEPEEKGSPPAVRNLREGARPDVSLWKSPGGAPPVTRAKYSATEEGVHIEHPITWDYHENR